MYALINAECNCSPLAMSNECDLITGRCQCMDGAIGLKCNDCAFGFTGECGNYTCDITVHRANKLVIAKSCNHSLHGISKYTYSKLQGYE